MFNFLFSLPWSFQVVYFRFHPKFQLSLFEESASDNVSVPVKRGRGRPPKLKAVVPVLPEKNSIKEDIMPTHLNTKIEFESDALTEENSFDPKVESYSTEASTETQWEEEEENQLDPFESEESEENIAEFDENSLDPFEIEYDENDQQPGVETRDFSQNQVSVQFSWSLMNQLRQMSKMEGVSVEDLLIELVAEGVAKRVFEEQSRPTPSHLMTRTGYVHSDGHQHAPQPHLSHHTMSNNNRQNINQNMQNRGRFNFQQRNNMQNQQQRGMNHNRNNNYQQNNNMRQQANGQNGFRNQYNGSNSQNRFNNNRQNSINNQRFYDDQSQSNQQQGNNNNRQSHRDHNKR